MNRAGSLLTIAAGLFALAFFVRSLYAVDLAPAMYTRAQPGMRMALRYDAAALDMLAGDGLLFPAAIDPSRTGLLARPPGYAIFLRTVYATLGRSFFTAQLVQNALNAVTPVLLFFLGARLFGRLIGLVAGLLAALSPHLAHTSNLLSPDALSAIPLAGAALVLAGGSLETGPSPHRGALAGALIGLSAWLRPNLVLMGPFLGAALILIAKERRRCARGALVLAAGASLVILPITLRNYAIFGEFIPISINGGLTLWEGVADAGGQRRFGARTTDPRVAREEARRYGRPRYAEWWAEPDGIWRDRDRYRRSMEAIKARPIWYLKAMLRRMAAMLSYHSAEAPLVAPRGGGSVAERAAAESRGVSDDEDRTAPGRAFEREEGRARPPRIPDRLTLAPGEFAGVARAAVRAFQALAAVVTLPLLLFGLLVQLRRAPRAALFVAAVPAYYLIFESMFIYEWRVAAPMHGYVFVLAAAGAVAVVSWLRARFRPSAPG